MVNIDLMWQHTKTNEKKEEFEIKLELMHHSMVIEKQKQREMFTHSITPSMIHHYSVYSIACLDTHVSCIIY